MAAINSVTGLAGARSISGPGSGPLAGRGTLSGAPPAATAKPRDAEPLELDSEAVSEITARLQETIDKVAREPHLVGFRHDPRARGFVIEIRDLEGKLVNQFPPEKLLNLREKLAELSGMVVDVTT